VRRAGWWLEVVGADGIFLDDYGYDFRVSRARQNDAIAYSWFSAALYGHSATGPPTGPRGNLP
jgi:hypothetical protein